MMLELIRGLKNGTPWYVSRKEKKQGVSEKKVLFSF